MATYFLSDLHILSAEDPYYRKLLNWMGRVPVSGDRVGFLGDIFDVFVGYKEQSYVEYADFFEVFKKSSVEWHYLEGNHDFKLGSREGLRVHDYEWILEEQGKRLVCYHGDLADPRDYAYRALRAVLRSPVTLGLSTVLPFSAVKKIGERSSRYSQAQFKSADQEYSANELDRMRRKYRNFSVLKIAEGFDHVIMGHCHDLDEMEFKLGEHSGRYTNIGFPRVHEKILKWENGELARISY